jgi:hypothetical protein
MPLEIQSGSQAPGQAIDQLRKERIRHYGDAILADLQHARSLLKKVSTLNHAGDPQSSHSAQQWTALASCLDSALHELGQLPNVNERKAAAP